MTSPEQSKPPGEAPAQTYGVPMYDIATPTTPEWLDGGTTVAPSGVEALAPTGVCGKGLRGLALRGEHLSLRRLRGASLRGLLLGEEPLHLAVQRGEKRASLAEPHLDRLALLRPLRDELLHLGPLGRKLGAVGQHRRPELHHLVRDLRVERSRPGSRCRSAG